jgi:hypothetical protein
MVLDHVKASSTSDKDDVQPSGTAAVADSRSTVLYVKLLRDKLCRCNSSASGEGTKYFRQASALAAMRLHSNMHVIDAHCFSAPGCRYLVNQSLRSMI